MDNINARVKNSNDSQVENSNNSQAVNIINSQVDNDNNPRVFKVQKSTAKPGRPRKYADKSEAMKAYRTRVTELQQENIDDLGKLTTAMLSDLLTKSLRTLSVAMPTPKTPITGEANEARKLAGRIIKELRARYTIRLG